MPLRHTACKMSSFMLLERSAQPVPDSKSRNIPEVVIVGAEQLGFWEFGEGGTVG